MQRNVSGFVLEVQMFQYILFVYDFPIKILGTSIVTFKHNELKYNTE